MTNDEEDREVGFAAAGAAFGDGGALDEPDVEEADPADDPQDDPAGEGSADPDPQGSDDEDGDAEGSTAASAGIAATILLPLVAADESGPSASTLMDDLGLSGPVASILDGVLDYALSFSDTLADNLGDSLGPAGKIGKGVSGLLDDGDNDGEESTGSTSGSSSDDAPTIGGVPGA